MELNNLTIGYKDRILLRGATVSFADNRLVALIGRNGTGKSTLLRTMAGLEHPIEGEIRITGEPIRQMSPAQRSRAISLVTTGRIRIANMRCRDVVGMGRAPYTDWIGRLSDADKRAVSHAIDLVGMTAYAERTIDSLSDGECQRIMIARALAQDTKIMLLDEPTSFLDLPNRYELCTLLAQLAHNEGKIVVFSTHELDIALQMADDVALIDNQELIFLPGAEMAKSIHLKHLFSPLWQKDTDH